jgi:3-oxoacyl-[acyl-carrier protein] reductase
MNEHFKGRRAVVTGASKGMGLAIAEELALLGAKVVLVARNTDSLNTAVDNIKAKGGEAFAVAGDVSKEEFAVELANKVNELLGGIDILVNNAGGPPMGTVLEQSLDVWNSALQTNLLSVIRLSKTFLPLMKAQNFGRILSITSTVAIEPSPEMVVSATVRSGVSAFTKAISTEFARFNITANVICPGGVETDRLKSLIKTRANKESREYQDVLTESQASIPAKRFASPSEVAGLALFLCSESGSYITGQSIPIDGGLTKGF